MESKIGVRYRKPPLVEALCEFRFRETAIPSNIILGRLYERIEEDFPTVETHRGIDVESAEDATSPAIIMEDTTRFISKDKTRLIQVGPGFLVANQIKQYKDYPSFRNFVKETMDVYYDVAKPEEFRYIGLRYINRIEMQTNQPLEAVFNIGFTIPAEFQSFPKPYLLRMEFPYCEERDRLIVILETAQPDDDDSANAVMLDFEYILIEPDDINDRFMEWMDQAHDTIEKAFHSCLTESVLDSFDPIQEKK